MLQKIGNDLSLSEQAYVLIKGAIMNNCMKPMEELSEEMLAAQLGISRTPVRSAIKKLAFEKLVVIRPGKTTIVADISEQDIMKVFAVRIALEPLAAQKAAALITPSQIEQLEAVLATQTTAMRQDDYSLYMMKEHEFHVGIASLAANDLLYEFVEKVNTQVQRFHTLSSALQASSALALMEHEQLIDRFKAKDVAGAGQTMLTHVENVARRMVQYFK